MLDFCLSLPYHTLLRMVENYSLAVGLGGACFRLSMLSLDFLQSSHTNCYLSINLLVFCLFFVGDKLGEGLVHSYYYVPSPLIADVELLVWMRMVISVCDWLLITIKECPSVVSFHPESM